MYGIHHFVHHQLIEVKCREFNDPDAFDNERRRHQSIQYTQVPNIINYTMQQVPVN